MRPGLSKILNTILADTQQEVARDKVSQPLAKLRSMQKEAPAVLPFRDALRQGFGLIAEIKECSPSQGPMPKANVDRAPKVYKQSPAVRAISVLTNRSHFGKSMTLVRMRKIKIETGKPVLRKDFIFDKYQVHQARAYGADAILLMANVLERDELHRLFDLASELGMDVLFETHHERELEDIPKGASIFGINCRTFDSAGKRYVVSRALSRVFNWAGFRHDLTTSIERFDYIKSLPKDAIKVAESGVRPEQCRQVMDLGFDAILVGTSLLQGDPIDAVMRQFEEAVNPLVKTAPALSPAIA